MYLNIGLDRTVEKLSSREGLRVLIILPNRQGSQCILHRQTLCCNIYTTLLINKHELTKHMNLMHIIFECCFKN